MIAWALLAAGLVASVTLVQLNQARIAQAQSLQELRAQSGLKLDEALVRVRGSLADPDADGCIEAPLGQAWAAGPAGGGKLPQGINPAKDAWGTPLGYCVWDNGSVVGGGRLAGGEGQDRTAYAVISAGPDRVFQTTCDALAAGNSPAPDDGARVASQGQVATGFGRKYFGDPVLSAAQLPATASEGAQRINLADGRNYIYYASLGWVKQAGLSTSPTGGQAIAGTAANGGMSTLASLSYSLLSLIDGSGRVLYAGAMNPATDSYSPTAILATQSLTLRATGMTGRAVLSADGPRTYNTGGYSAYYDEALSCPGIIDLVGEVKGTANGAACIPANYQPVGISGAVGLPGRKGVHGLPGPSSALLPDGSFKTRNANGSWSVTHSGVVAVQYTNGSGYLTNTNTLVPPHGTAYQLAGVRAFTFTSYTYINGVTAYLYPTYAVMTDGTLRAMGGNYGGELARGTVASGNSYAAYSPQPWAAVNLNGSPITGVKGVAAGWMCLAVVTTDGKLYSAGTGCSGANLSTTANLVQDTTIIGVVNAWMPRHIVNGIVVQTSDGALWAKGVGGYGQFAQGHTGGAATWVRVL